MITVKSFVRECKRDSSRTHARYLYTTDLSLSGEEIEELHRDVKALGLEDSWRRERLQGYLTIFTVTNVVS